MAGMASANISGEYGESMIGDLLDSLEINYERQKKLKIPYIFYGHYNKIDYFLPGLDISLEVKNQKVTGSTDEKWAYSLIKFLLKKFPTSKFTILFLGKEPRKDYFNFMAKLKKEIYPILSQEAKTNLQNNFFVFTDIELFKRWLIEQSRNS